MAGGWQIIYLFFGGGGGGGGGVKGSGLIR